MEGSRHGSTQKLVALFVTVALVAGTGCSNTSANSNCVDQNGDGYCDNGRSGGSSSLSRGIYNPGSSESQGTNSSSGISQGSSSHGGIGSSSSASSS